MNLERLPDWNTRVANALADRAARPFAWGVNDCAIFAADVIEAATGHDLAAPYRGRYRSRRGASLTLKANGWASLADLADSLLPRQADHLRRGDIVLYAGRHGDFLGVVWAGGVFGPDDRGVRVWPLDRGLINGAWKVG